MFPEGCRALNEQNMNTDGKSTYNTLKDDLTAVNVHVDYKDPNHRLYWLNTVIGNIQNQIIGIYHGIAKRDLPLFLAEQEYRFNHRYTGSAMADKICKYFSSSYPCPRRGISKILDALTPIYTPAFV